MLIDIISNILAGAVGAGATIAYYHTRKPKPHVEKIEFSRFPESIRIRLVVENKGPTSAIDATAQLTVKALYKDKWLKGIPSKLLPTKPIEPSNGHDSGKDGEKCGKEWDYLVDKPSREDEPASIDREYLPWTTPKEYGKGLDECPYKHATDIPPGGAGRVDVMDIYKSDECYVIRVFSEYGAGHKPRAVLVLPLKQLLAEELVFEVRIGCADCARTIRDVILRRHSYQDRLVLRYRCGDYELVFRDRRWPLRQLLENIESHGTAKMLCKGVD